MLLTSKCNYKYTHDFKTKGAYIAYISRKEQITFSHSWHVTSDLIRFNFDDNELLVINDYDHKLLCFFNDNTLQFGIAEKSFPLCMQHIYPELFKPNVYRFTLKYQEGDIEFVYGKKRITFKLVGTEFNFIYEDESFFISYTNTLTYEDPIRYKMKYNGDVEFDYLDDHPLYAIIVITRKD